MVEKAILAASSKRVALLLVDGRSMFSVDDEMIKLRPRCDKAYCCQNASTPPIKRRRTIDLYADVVMATAAEKSRFGSWVSPSDLVGPGKVLW